MKSIKASIILSGAIFLGLAVSAQSTPSNPGSSDTTRRMGIHRHSRSFNDGDSLHRQQGWAGGRWDRNGSDRSEDRRFGDRRFGGHDGRGEGRMRHIHYSPDQRKQLVSINIEYRKRSEELYQKDNSTLREYKAGLIALQKEKKSKLQALLTPSQKEEIAKWKAKRTENEQVMAAAHMERLKLRLNLSDEQVAKLKSGQASLRTQMQSVHENENLLPEQKREQMKGLMAQRKDALKSVLTPDQLSKFQEMRKNRGHRMEGRGMLKMDEESK